MKITEWKEEEDKSYWECLASLKEGLDPIMKLRAVRNNYDKYIPIVRAFGGTGVMLGGGYGAMDLESAKEMTIVKALSILRLSSMKVE